MTSAGFYDNNCIADAGFVKAGAIKKNNNKTP